MDVTDDLSPSAPCPLAPTPIPVRRKHQPESGRDLLHRSMRHVSCSFTCTPCKGRGEAALEQPRWFQARPLLSIRLPVLFVNRPYLSRVSVSCMYLYVCFVCLSCCLPLCSWCFYVWQFFTSCPRLRVRKNKRAKKAKFCLWCRLAGCFC